LNELPQKLTKNVYQTAFKEVLKNEVLPVVKINNPYPKYNKDVVIKNSKNSVGAVLGFSTNAFIMRWVEYGTNQRKTKKGQDRGEMDAKPWLESTFKSTVPAVIKKVNEEFGEIVTKIIGKRLKSVNKKISKMK
jgi:hypothetical protein